MSRVSISEPVLSWALDRSGKRAVIERKFPKLSLWLRGMAQPTLRQIEELAKVTSTPLGYLFLSEPPDERLPIPLFRTHGVEPLRRPSPDLLETVQTMERRQAWMRDYLIEQGNEPFTFVRSEQISNDPKSIARQIRRLLGLDEQWAAKQYTWTGALRELQKKVEEVGILLAVSSIVGNNTHRRLEPSEFRGFVLVDEYAPLVFVNGADSKAAQMFTLAHELAHIWFGSSAAFDLRELEPADDEIERACNLVAAELLVAADELRAFWPSIRENPERYQAVARQFKVSEIVAARRALDLQLITKREYLSSIKPIRNKIVILLDEVKRAGIFMPRRIYV